MTAAHGFEQHNHATCIRDGLQVAERICAERGLQLTPVRRRVLEYLLGEHRALGAYEILDRLRGEGLGKQPPVAYRALDFLVSHGFAHRVEKLNAFIACGLPGQRHDPAFLICSSCGTVAEALSNSQSDSLAQAAKASGFAIKRTVIEAEGTCPSCTDAEEAPCD
ncbi:MAG: transcriptional repressor [Mangrovicoccus sp.]|nr:transcriptional repressor [Mangrovicoccus sp.]